MKKILIIEDDIFLRELYTDILTEGKYEITTAVNGEEAIRSLIKGGWDLVLLDVMLPHHTGFEVMEKVQQDAKFKKTFPIVFFTNLDNPQEKAHAEKLGDGYIIKSQMSPPELLEALEKYLK